ncbi:MAG: class I SAM-dependent methyltransferase [Kofleriaceae bacterium]
MDEPYLSQFRALIADHAASRDVHDQPDGRGFASDHGTASDAFVAREVGRVAVHQRSLVPLLAPVGHAANILDFGCGTGGTTLAIALAKQFKAEHVIGVDANPRAIAAARVRATSYHGDKPTLSFQPTIPGEPLPFVRNSFDLVTSVSVLEFITDHDGRAKVIADLQRVVRPGGYVFIATPRPWFREYHSRRWLGDFDREPGFPWSSSTRELRAWFAGWQEISLEVPLAAIAATRAPWAKPLLGATRSLLPHVTRWQKRLFRKP